MGLEDLTTWDYISGKAHGTFIREFLVLMVWMLARDSYYRGFDGVW